MIIVGLTGGIGHGKTTFAQFLAGQTTRQQHFETWEIVAEVADGLRAAHAASPPAEDMAGINEWLHPLPDLLYGCTHCSIDFTELQLTPERLKARPEHYEKLFDYLRLVAANPSLGIGSITLENKEQFRPLLQWLGGYLVAVVGSGVWYDEIIRRIHFMQTTGYELVTVGGVRFPGDAERLRNASGMIIEIHRPDLPLQDIKDITERERRNILPDSRVLNDGSLEQLARCAETMWDDLKRHQPAEVYQASAF